MSLFSSIQMANNTLQAQQIGLQVVGQNIANANTPGYVREQVNFAPAPTQQLGGLLLGLGVQVDGIRQKIDNFLEERLRGANAETADSAVQQQTYEQLEGLVNELSDQDLSSSLNNFFNSIADVLNKPNDSSTRNLVVLKGTTLTQDLSRLASRVQSERLNLDDRVSKMADDINRLVERIRTLNVQITSAEAGTSAKSDAVGLRDSRLQALSDLSKLININVQEQTDGSVLVYNGGNYLVFGGLKTEVEAAPVESRGQIVSSIRFTGSNATLEATGGELAGLISSRDDVIGSFLDGLDDVSQTLAYEFNRIYSSGQGLKGFTDLTSNSAVTDVNQPLDDAGLAFSPQNGSFQIKLYNTQTQLTQTYDIQVKLTGLDNDTTLTSLAAQLNAISGLSATITSSNKLNIKSTATDQQFAFANDTSGALASLGLNTFFTGSSSLGLGVDANVAKDPALFAASAQGVGAGTDNATQLAAFLTRPLDAKSGSSLQDTYNQFVGKLTQNSSAMKATADGFNVYQQTLIGQKNATSGVSLDEETINMLSFQRAFQASAKYIAALNDLLGIMVNL